MLSLPPVARLRFAPAFSDAGPGRVVVIGDGATPDPVFGNELLDFRIDDRRAKSGSETRELYFLGNRHDPLEFEIAPGDYRLLATRGLEYDVVRDDLGVSGFHVREATSSRLRIGEALRELQQDLAGGSIDEHGRAKVVIGLAAIDDHHRVAPVHNVERNERCWVDAQG